MENSKFEQIEALSDAEFQALIDEYNHIKLGMYSPEEQEKIIRIIKNESFRRMNLFMDDEVKKQNIPEEKVLDSSIAKSKIGAEIRDVDKAKRTFCSTAPQKICDIGKSLLNNIKINVKKIKEQSLMNSINTEEQVVDYNMNNFESKKEEINIIDDGSLAAIDDALDSFMLDFQSSELLNDSSKYVAENDTINRKISKIDKPEVFVSILKPGVVRKLTIPLSRINKLSKGQFIKQQSAIGM